jgi:hypothetical protein
VVRLADILDVTDALMVARGDLGVEMPLEKVPGVQKQITRAARASGKPVVVATQMLESMISSPVPTRAEVSDVATAIFEGADAVMLSAESAAGQFPVEAVTTMNRIAEEVERDPNYRSIIHAQRTDPEATGADAIAAATRQIAETLDLAAIVCWTSSGATALRVARERPATAIIAISPNVATGRRLAGVWGVHCVVAADAHDQDDMVDRACRIAFREGFAKAGERVIVVAGVPLGTPGATNMLRIAYVGQDAAMEEQLPVIASPRVSPSASPRVNSSKQSRASRDDVDVLAALHHLVLAQLELAVADAFAGLHVVLVAVPRADEMQVVREGLALVGAVGRDDVDHAVDQQPLARRAARVQAGVAVGVVGAAGEEHADLMPASGDDAPVAVGELRCLGDEPLGHECLPQMPRTAIARLLQKPGVVAIGERCVARMERSAMRGRHLRG